MIQNKPTTDEIPGTRSNVTKKVLNDGKILVLDTTKTLP